MYRNIYVVKLQDLMRAGDLDHQKFVKKLNNSEPHKLMRRLNTKNELMSSDVNF